MAAKLNPSNGKPKKKTRKSNKLDLEAVSMKAKSRQPNPFETISSRRKFDILGKKRKGEEQRISISRSTAIDKRNKTLLKEYEQRGKSSLFEDKRIGEHNEHLEEFDKAVMRSQREHKRPKSKKEVMEEIIKTSKFFKAQKSMENDEKKELVEELDDKFKSLLQASTLLPLIQSNLPRQKENSDSFDILVNEMVLDARVRPSDRKKTPEEIAQEEKEKLEQLEEERRKRMLAPDNSSDEDEETVTISTTETPKHISGDDLGDSFSHEDGKSDRKGWVDEIFERENRIGSDEDDDPSSDNVESSREDDSDSDGTDKCEHNEDNEPQEVKDWEQSDDEKISTDVEESEGDGDDEGDDQAKVSMTAPNDTVVDTDMTNCAQKPHRSKELLPFVIGSPVTFEEFYMLVEDRSESDIIEVINRIRTCNAIKLAAENRRKMQVFYGILLQYFAILANKRPLNLSLLNLLVRPLMEMSVETPYFAAICARERISQARLQFCKALTAGTSCWPSVKMVALLRLWSMLFPCTDFRHAVQTPAILLMCEYLMRCPVISGKDAALGCFLCSMVLSVVKQSKKFCPEALVFLRRIFYASVEGRSVSCQGFPEITGTLLHIWEKAKTIVPLSFTKIVGMDDGAPYFSSNNFRAGLLFSAVDTLQGFAEAYQELDSFPEIFNLILKLLSEVLKQEHIPDTLRDKINSVTQFITEKSHHRCAVRKPLQMMKQKPVPIKLLTPKFEENFVKGRDYDPDRERTERRKLNKLLKREAKGAARELRKDNHFLFQVKEKQRALVAEERAERYGKAKAFLQEQEHSFKSGQLGKGTKRRS